MHTTRKGCAIKKFQQVLTLKYSKGLAFNSFYIRRQPFIGDKFLFSIKIKRTSNGVNMYLSHNRIIQMSRTRGKQNYIVHVNKLKI